MLDQAGLLTGLAATIRPRYGRTKAAAPIRGIKPRSPNCSPRRPSLTIGAPFLSRPFSTHS